MKKVLIFILLLLPINSFALDFINDFEWLEPNNKVEVVVGESHQLRFSCSDNSLPFTSDYADCWNHYDFSGGQHMVSSPTGYSIDERGVITGLIPGSYAIKFTRYRQTPNNLKRVMPTPSGVNHLLPSWLFFRFWRFRKGTRFSGRFNVYV